MRRFLLGAVARKPCSFHLPNKSPAPPTQKAPDTTRGIPFPVPKGLRRPGPGGRGKPSFPPGAREGPPQGKRVRGLGVRGRHSSETRPIFKNSDFDLASGGGAAH